MNKNELVDLVDDSGGIVRTAIPRSEAELLNGHELHIPIIGCVILNSLGEVLVHKRAAGKRFAGCIDHIYGAIASGETPEQAAERECEEELGIKPVTVSRVEEGPNVHNYYQYLFAVIYNDSPQNISEREVSWAKYMSVDSLRAALEAKIYTFTENFFIDLEAVLASR